MNSVLAAVLRGIISITLKLVIAAHFAVVNGSGDGKMNIIDAFLKSTAFSYLGCLILTILGRPPLAFIGAEFQGVIYIFAFIVFMAASIDVFPQYVYSFLGAVYGIVAVVSFLGWPQVWMAYWTSAPEGGSAAGQIGMAAWDLAIAVSYFMKTHQERK